MLKLICHHYKGIPKLNNVLTSQRISIRRFRTGKNNYKEPIRANDYVNKLPLIAKSLVFTVGFSGSLFSLATIAQFEKMDLYKYSTWGLDSKKSNIVHWLDNMSDTKKVVFDIVLLNGLVFLVSNYLTRRGSQASLKRFVNHFYLSPTSNNLSQMLLCTFNHNGFIHLAANMFCLYSISGMFDRLVAPEQFFAFYLSAGVFSSFCSKTFNLLASRSIVSVGASGAVVSCFALASFFYPDSTFYIFPLPFPIEAQDLLKGIVGMDLAGLVLGFKVIDHVAHLGGAFYAYALFGNEHGKQYFKKYQRFTIQSWVTLRNKFK